MKELKTLEERLHDEEVHVEVACSECDYEGYFDDEYVMVEKTRERCPECGAPLYVYRYRYCGNCGERVDLYGFTNECQCGECYNMAGQHVNPEIGDYGEEDY